MKVYLKESSTLYMDGTSVYHLKYEDKPGIITTLVLSLDEKEQLERLLSSSK